MKKWEKVSRLYHYCSLPKMVNIIRSTKNRPTGDVMREWDDKRIIDEIYDGYFQYHQERLENTFDDINCLAAAGKHMSY